ncbi:transposase-like zinc-binding domain-containing protein [Glaesserella parasuis]|uniref:transposase-like zinc-binding domain-containing protein n=1 Tax=Glaesserella parasuis TaxID=738 RepID=UPI003C6F4EE1
MKTCPFCLKNNIQKYGKKNNIQRYFCSSCHKAFSFTKKLNSIDIWTDYTIGKQTYKQLSEKYHCSIRTVQRLFIRGIVCKKTLLSTMPIIFDRWVINLPTMPIIQMLPY